MGTPESFVICSECRCVMRSDAANHVSVEYDELEYVRVLETQYRLCLQCFNDSSVIKIESNAENK